MFGEATIRDVINDYEEKVADLELKLYNKDKNEAFMLNERISELEYERERLTRALEIVSDRRFDLLLQFARHDCYSSGTTVCTCSACTALVSLSPTAL